MSDPLSQTFDVTVDGETYVFRKPGIRYTMELGYRAADVRRRAYPAAGGMLGGELGLDYAAVQFSRCCAILELYLAQASDAWPFSPGGDGKPMVDFDRFPADREQTVFNLGAAFEREVARFRARGNPDQPHPGAETVAGQQDPG